MHWKLEPGDTGSDPNVGTDRSTHVDCHVNIMELIPAANYLPADVERNDRALGVMHMYKNDIVNGAGNETGI